MTLRSCCCALAALFLSTQIFAATITVTSTDDTVTASDGKVTLREAITAINAGTTLADPDIVAQNPTTPNAFGISDTINFNIAGAGVQMISTVTDLPTINKAVFVNGYSQPGSSANSNPLSAGINSVLRIEINCQPGGIAFDVLAPGSEFRGLAIHGYRAFIVSANNVVVAGNFIGTDAAGTTVLPTATGGTIFGVQVSSGATPVGGTIVGGPSAADRNLINAQVGVQIPFVAPGPGTGFVIQGNYIGTDITGTLAIGNGLGLSAISNAQVTGNLISGNSGGGIQLLDSNTVQGNFIGTQRDGVSPLPNGNFGGIEIHGGNSLIGGNGAGQANTIAHHIGSGINIYTGSTQGSSNVNTRNRISRNSIYANAGLGISIDYSAFVLANDAGDGDSWAAKNIGNDGQNYPVITSATQSAGTVSVAGTLNSIASSTYTIEFFANAACSAVGYGEGQTFIGSATATTDASGNASFGPLTFSVPASQLVITSTATDAVGNTSEFSQCLAAAGGPAPTTTSVISSLNPSVLGQSVTFTATVNVTGSTGPTGSVQFKDGSGNLGSPVASSGTTTFTFTTSALTLGTHPITAVYAGDANNSPSTSPALSQLVNSAAAVGTTTTIVSSLNPAPVGASVTFTASVSTTQSAIAGTVTFSDAGSALSTSALIGGVATFTISTLSVGNHPVQAAYSGDAANAASSASLIEAITPLTQTTHLEPAPILSTGALISLASLLALIVLWRSSRASLLRRNQR
jgi:titin